MAHSWNDFSKDSWKARYMPAVGDGDTMASQAETALNRLVYKWFNDGDVYDNHYGMEGFGNDVSGSANWLAGHFPGARQILLRIESIGSSEDAYTEILYDLCSLVYDTPGLLDSLNAIPRVGSAYFDGGEFSVEYMDDDDEDEDDEDDGYWG